MGTKERRDRERQELRQAILLASREIAAREGWQAVSMRKVAERIEYSPPTIYEHFASKEALLLELMREGFRLLMGRVQAGSGSAAAPDARIRAVALAYWDFAWDYPELYQVMHGLGGVPFTFDAAVEAATGMPNLPGSEQFLPEAKAVFQFTMDALKDLVGGGEHDCDEREASVHILWATLHGLVALTMAKRIDGGRAQAADLVERAVRAFLLSQRVTEDKETSRPRDKQS
jgi:AcrR family transcriptional regulator